jgi:EpsI family protein
MGNERTRLSVLFLLFALTFGAVHASTRYRHEQKRKPNWAAIPNRIGEWSGTDSTFDPVYGSDPADESLLRIYTKDSAPPVIAYVGFYANLATILEVHTPELCYPAQGWRILRVGQSNTASFRGERIVAREILTDKDGRQRLVMWWYNAGPRPFESRIRYVYAMLLASSLTGRTDGSMVRFETPVDDAGEAAARQRIESFRQDFITELEKGLPK